MPLREAGELLVLQTSGLIVAVVEDRLMGRPVGEIAARFHASLAQAAEVCCVRLRDDDGPRPVALSGGTFQNRRFLRDLTDRLTARGFTVYRHRQVPPNDGGLSLGQAVLANQRFG